MRSEKFILQNLIIPLGTQVVTKVEVMDSKGRPVRPSGLLGIIVQAPTDPSHSYLVKLADGTLLSLKRHQLIIRKEQQHEHINEIIANLEEYDMEKFLIYRCITGSRAYGLDSEESDTDYRGIYLPPADLHWSIFGVPEQIEIAENEECYWEMEKFITLALKANPNILECLYTPLVELMTPLAQELISMRAIFVSQLVFQTYNGYAMSQFKKMEADLRNHGNVKWKHAMHLIRLLLNGIQVLKEGTITVIVTEHRDRLLSIKSGGEQWESIDKWRLELNNEFEEEYKKTRLPARPDYNAANKFLIKARRSMADRQS
jgi:predicted nucleotidyltransferase